MRSSFVFLPACAAGLLLFGCGSATDPYAELMGDEAVAREAVRRYVERGLEALPELEAGLETDSAAVRRHCRTAIGSITGQWGWKDGLIWERSVEAASGKDKPLMVLHLFGNFDEEFC